MEKIQRALVSVSEKRGIVVFVRRLHALGIEVLSTGGTARALRDARLPVTDVSDYTGFPELLDGRVKTLHPMVHGGLLYLRDNPAHRSAALEHGIRPIDMVVVNLYPFRETQQRPDATHLEIIEQIDIGGPSMLRSAAKNHRFVTVVSSPDLYDEVADELERNSGVTSPELRRRLAYAAFRHTADYDLAIARYLGVAGEGMAAAAAHAEGGGVPEVLDIRLARGLELRYGENPHQVAGYYGDLGAYFDALHGKALSYNNILDLTAAQEVVDEFPLGGPGTVALAIIKHGNPCGVATAETVSAAWEKALATDPDAASGGIVAVNSAITLEAARALHEFFTEVIAAPEFAPAALEYLKQKRNRILIRTLRPVGSDPTPRLRSVPGGVLAQSPDLPGELSAEELRVVTRRAPDDAELQALRFAWRVVKHVRSNAIVFTAEDRTLGVGAGQMARVDSVRVAREKARRAGLDLEGSAVASDAFFPFPDGLIECAEAGATAVVQPGGSRRDDAVIRAADERGMAMVFTGRRHFRH